MTKENRATNRPGTGSRRPRSHCCRKNFERVYQFKVSLQEIEPTIWRRIQVPDRYSFWDLHCAITDSFGWLDYHLHQFTIVFPESGETDRIGILDEHRFEDDPEVLPGWILSITEYFSMENKTCDYEYDFGDGWRHSVVLEEILPRAEGVGYPRCIGGGRACPPEDVGGPPGYEEFLKAISYHNAPEHNHMLQWVGGWFDLDLIRFGSPQKRWDIAFINEPVPKTLRMVQYHMMRGTDVRPPSPAPVTSPTQRHVNQTKNTYRNGSLVCVLSARLRRRSSSIGSVTRAAERARCAARSSPPNWLPVSRQRGEGPARAPHRCHDAGGAGVPRLPAGGDHVGKIRRNRNTVQDVSPAVPFEVVRVLSCLTPVDSEKGVDA